MSQFLAQRAKKASSLTADGFGYGATIDARVLWDLLRDLIRLGMEPSRLRHRRQDQGQTHEARGGDA
jgi:hypothetical protein